MIFNKRKFKKVISDLLPLNQQGTCFYCGIGNKPDNEYIHFDQDNCWGGDQYCLYHSKYEDARKLLGISK